MGWPPPIRAPLMRVPTDPRVGQAGTQHALAVLLASPRLLDRLADGDTELLRRRFALTDAEIETLLAAGIPRLRRFAHRLRVKRMRLVTALMPVTTGALECRYGTEHVASEFWTAFPPVAAELGWEVRERHMEWCRRYAQRLSTAGGPEWLGDLARYEEIRERARRGIPAGPDVADGACQPGRPEAPGRPGHSGAPDRPDEVPGSAGCPRLRRGARLACFSYDVVALYTDLAGMGDRPLPEAAPRPTYVVAAPAAGSGVSAGRLGPAAFRVLRMCTGDVPVPQIAVAAMPDVPEERALTAVAGILRQAAQSGFLVPGEVSR